MKQTCQHLLELQLSTRVAAVSDSACLNVVFGHIPLLSCHCLKSNPRDMATWLAARPQQILVAHADLYEFLHKIQMLAVEHVQGKRAPPNLSASIYCTPPRSSIISHQIVSCPGAWKPGFGWAGFGWANAHGQCANGAFRHCNDNTVH